MLDYARQRVSEVLRVPRKAILVTNGPAGIQAGVFPCEAIDLALYLLVPKTSDHLFNLEHDSVAILLAEGWELKGQAQVIPTGVTNLMLDFFCEPGAEWCELLRVKPCHLQIRREEGWGNLETIDLNHL